MEAALKLIHDKITVLMDEVQAEYNKDGVTDRQKIMSNQHKIDLLQIARAALEKV